MRLLIIGGSGLLGYKTATLAAKEHETYGTYNYRQVEIKGVTGLKLDKSDRVAVIEVFEKVKPEAVIDTAALHNVDYCETHEDEARRVNVEATRNVAEACCRFGAKMIFLSTDYVFDGEKDCYDENDETSPINVYGKTKLEAEKVVMSAGMPYVIARPAVIYGWNPGEVAGLKSSSGKPMNFVIWALMKLKNGEQIKAVTDQYSQPTLADNLAEVLLATALSNLQGTFHTAGKSCVNRFDFTVKIAEIFGFNKDLVKPAKSDEFKQVARRPRKCCLNVEKAQEAFSVKLLSVEEGLGLMKSQQSETANNR
jgi:dTDP-4-dehydrorhamnose reductase